MDEFLIDPDEVTLDELDAEAYFLAQFGEDPELEFPDYE